MKTTVRVVRGFDVAPETVFGAWLDAATASRWLFATATQPLADAAIDARVAGRFRLVEQRLRGSVQYSGEYLELVPGRRLVFTLQSEASPPSRVTVDIRSHLRGSRIVVTHEDVDATCAASVRARWSGMLHGLRETIA
jgi:uncharacterized protein YndB with AHSA1/START domain